jgi:hypothetical protein
MKQLIDRFGAGEWREKKREKICFLLEINSSHNFVYCTQLNTANHETHTHYAMGLSGLLAFKNQIKYLSLLYAIAFENILTLMCHKD